MINSDSLKISIREHLNPYLGYFRRKKYHIKEPFTIISNNCWAGHVYRYFNLPYSSPTIGLFLFSEDYIKLCYHFTRYMKAQISFISLNDSKYKEILKKRGHINVPIGKLDDIEIIFLHYRDEEEAKEKWERRKARINYNNLLFKMSEQNMCKLEHLKEFDRLPTKRKFVFVTKDYGLQSQVIFYDFFGKEEVLNDTTNFRKYINLAEFITGKVK